MSSSRKYFGTDGIRGAVGSGVITPDFILKLGWAAGNVFKRYSKNGHSKVLIGKDTRISGYMIESVLEAGLSAAGVDINLLGPMPTPAIAYLTRTFHAQAGIVISASHNPYADNGIKFFSADGKKLPDEVELAIEAELDKPMVCVDSANLGKAKRIEDARGRYIEFCKSSVPSGLSLHGLKVVLDCAHGATYHTAPEVFKELGAKVTCIGTQPDGLNINEGYGSTSPENLQRKVLELGADLGIAYDGDGDRVMMVDEKGELVDGDELLMIITDEQRRNDFFCGGVVGTLMSNLGLELALKARDIPFVRAKVGDRYVMAELEKRGWKLGGESSGHIVWLGATSTGDGIISSLQAVLAVVHQGKTLHQLKSAMTKCPQVMINVKRTKTIELDNNDSIQKAIANAENRLAARGRVLLRPSGTEPVIRVMVEGEDSLLIEQIANELAEIVQAQTN